jgi:hypothetical protein
LSLFSKSEKKMGASLARLIVIEYDLETMTGSGYHLTIDLAGVDPLKKANSECKVTNKNKLVRTIYIPLVMEKVIGEYWENGVQTETIVDIENVHVLPVHKIYGGTSFGFGSDPELEAKLELDPGSFKVGDKEYFIKDFQEDVEKEKLETELESKCVIKDVQENLLTEPKSQENL